MLSCGVIRAIPRLSRFGTMPACDRQTNRRTGRHTHDDSIASRGKNSTRLTTGCIYGYKIAVLTYKVLHGTAPRYLGPLDRVADLNGRRALRSASSSRLVVPMFRLSTVGSRAFNVTGSRIWNELPEEVISAPTFFKFPWPT